jgi:hypothetical protein
MSALNTIGNVLTLLVLIVGLVMTLIAYFKRGKSRVALLGALGFLLMFLLSCCALSFGISNQLVLRQIPPKAQQTFFTVRQIVLFLLGLLNVLGLGLLIAAMWTSSKKD